MADSGTGEVLAAHDPHLKLPPASTLKTLFALTVLPALPAGIRHRQGGGTGGHRRRQQLGGRGRGAHLPRGRPVARRLSQLRQRRRARTGRDERRLAPDGGPDAGQGPLAGRPRHPCRVARRLRHPRPGLVGVRRAVFGRAGLRNPEFARYCSTAEATFPGDGYPYQIQNTNRLLTGADGVAPYPGLIGVDGYAANAGNTLVAAAHRGGRTLLVTVMNPQAGGGAAVYEEARSLLNWGFAAAGHVEPVGSLPDSRSVPAAGASPVQARTGSAGGPDGGWPEAAGILGAAGLGAGGWPSLCVSRACGPPATDPPAATATAPV